MSKGSVVSIFVAPKAGKPMISLPEVRAVPGKGLEGDRYFKGIGYYSDNEPGREITLIEIEVLDSLKSDYLVELTPQESRRNIATRGISLNVLVGRTFRVGEVVVQGIRLCEPCLRIEQLTRKKLMIPLLHRGGLRARVLTEGVIQVGDVIQEVEEYLLTQTSVCS